MITTIAVLALGLNLQGDPQKDLADLVARAQKVQSYTFELTTTNEGGFQRAGGAPAAPVKGAFQNGKPVRLEAGGTVAFREGRAAVHQDAEGNWVPLDARAMMRGGRGGFGGQRGGGPPGGEAGERPERSERPERGEGPPPGERPDRAEGGARPEGGPPEPDPERAAMFARLAALRAQLPHQLLSDFAGGAVEVVCEEAEGVRTFRGELDADTAARMSGGGFGGRGGRGFPGGGGGSELEHSGSFVLVADAKGVITRFEVETRSSGVIRDREINMARKSAVVLGGVNATEVEVPEAAAAALKEAARPAPEEDEIF